ncbi:MAG: 9-O-acetylesterase, partial [Prevotellaceae bacterium]|nr:9-O-acetylesterase [Prevotellaceae bacterium]
MENKLILKGTWLFVWLFLSFPSFSAITLPEIFSDNLVLQQQTDAPIWGKATGKNVKITTSWDNQTYTTQPDANGKWLIRVKTPGAGGPYSISISDGKKLTLKNILIGEVWICSGQSNMEMPLAGWGKILNY